MIDFTTEHIIDIESLATKLDVNSVTIRRWFARGLEHAKVGGRLFTSLEAVQRFSTQGENQVHIRAVEIDPETLAALRNLRSQGIGLDSEAHSVGMKKKAEVR